MLRRWRRPGCVSLWVPIIRSWALTRGYALHPGTSCVASFTGSGGLLARLAVRRGRSKDLEIIVLRHQLGVLHRRNNRPQLADEDRALLGAVAAALPRRRRAGWLVTSETLLRWHRRRTARPRTQPSGTPGRPSTSGSLRRLILETANDNPVGARNGVMADQAVLTQQCVGGDQPVGAHNSVVGADQGFRAPSGDQESVRDSGHEDSASAPIAAGQRPRPSFRHPQVSRSILGPGIGTRFGTRGLSIGPHRDRSTTTAEFPAPTGCPSGPGRLVRRRWRTACRPRRAPAQATRPTGRL